MQSTDFESLVRLLCQQADLPQALELLKMQNDEAIAQAANELTGQFALAEVNGEKRIYHVSVQQDEQGQEQEFVEHIMNEGDDLVRFVAWFFTREFDIKTREVYQAAGKTYRQPKRSE